jgi:hypothetical protein
VTTTRNSELTRAALRDIQSGFNSRAKYGNEEEIVNECISVLTSGSVSRDVLHVTEFLIQLFQYQGDQFSTGLPSPPVHPLFKLIVDRSIDVLPQILQLIEKGEEGIPVAGKDVTRVISDALQIREEVVVDSPDMGVALSRLAKQVKEKLAYVCSDPIRELKLFDSSKNTLFKRISWTDPRKNLQRECDIGYEQFLGPEMFFQPSLVSATVNSSLPMIVAEAVQASPIDYRRSLLGNIVLSGGSTLFSNFDKRLEHDVGLMMNGGPLVKVHAKPDIQRFAVWHGASEPSQTAGFERMIITKAEYEEKGPYVARETAIT